MAIKNKVICLLRKTQTVNIKAYLLDKTFHFLGMVQEPWYTWLNALANRYILFRNPERLTHPGNLYPEETFYIIDDLPPAIGLGGWYDRVLGYMARAQKKGWTPIVSPQPSAQPDSGDWSTFFVGPTSEIPLVDALKGRNVVHATMQGMIHKRYNRKEIALRHRLGQGIRLSTMAQEVVDRALRETFIRPPCVGVMFRGTDYRKAEGNYTTGHAKVPDVEWFCTRVAEDLHKWHIADEDGASLFVVTEEQEALDAIRRRFPKCMFVRKERYTNFKPGKWLVYQRLPNTTPRDNNFLYLADIVGLSRCQYLIGGINGCVLMALNLNGNQYKAVDILNTGVN